MLEIRHLKTLQALFKFGSFSLAANDLCITTSALSHQISSLEKYLDCQLISRQKRPIQFTNQGLLLLDLAQQVLPIVDQKMNMLLNKNPTIKHKLLVASECHCCFDWLLQVFNEYNHLYPEIDLDFITAFEKYPHEMLSDDSFDILITSDKPKLPDIQYTKLFEYESRLVIAKDHPLAFDPDITPEKLANETLISHPVGLERLDIYNHFFLPAKITPQKVRHTQLTPMLIQLVANHRGIAALPDWVVYEFEQRDLIKTLRFPTEDNSGLLCTLYAAYKKENTEHIYFTEFINQMKKYAKQRDLFYLN